MTWVEIKTDWNNTQELITKKINLQFITSTPANIKCLLAYLLPKRLFHLIGTASVKACSCQSNLATSLSDVAQGELSFLGQ